MNFSRNIFKNRPSDIDDHDRAIYRFPSFLDWQDCYVHPNTLVPRELPAKDKLATRDLGSYRLTVDNQDEAVPMGVEHVIVEEGIIVIEAKKFNGRRALKSITLPQSFFDKTSVHEIMKQ